MLSTENFKIKHYSETPLDDLFNQLQTERESFTNVQSPDSDIQTESENVISNPQIIDNAESLELSSREINTKRQSTAKFLAKNTDRAMAFVCAMIAETDDVAEWKADSEDVIDIQTAYFEMCSAYGWTGMPPWVNLALALTFTYGPIIKEAVKVRGLNAEIIRRAVAAEANLAMERENSRLKEEKASNVKKAEKIVEKPIIKENSTDDNSTDSK